MGLFSNRFVLLRDVYPAYTLLLSGFSMVRGIQQFNTERGMIDHTCSQGNSLFLFQVTSSSVQRENHRFLPVFAGEAQFFSAQNSTIFRW